MSLTAKISRALARTPLGRQADKIVKLLKIALVMFVVVLVTSFLCLLIVTAYVLMHLIQGN